MVFYGLLKVLLSRNNGRENQVDGLLSQIGSDGLSVYAGDRFDGASHCECETSRCLFAIIHD